ncbi:hypothetical protein TEA_010319 [Camellia sinensis var. sinensis]|uniref:MCM C-terminal AAA(+) ATPase domain-containing protein n=1 Tax=Camellia sinensis var. sinensis TaxID=542762 RepID=A0A4S4DFI3_CAMSN|nr:hypothetical protein TEA_010319 [Camellia sinensis var. sinensis]
MYGTHRESMNSNSKYRSKENIDIAKILATYFPDIDLSANESKVKFNLASKLVAFFSTPPGLDLVSQVKDDDDIYFLSLDFQQFRKICELEDFYAALEENPKEALSCMSAAVHKVLSTKCGNNMLEDGAKINIRLHNYPESIIALKNLKTAYIDRLVSVRGTVVKVSTVRPLVVQMSFYCSKCRADITCNFPDGKFSPPLTCEGRVPRTVECELTEDLVDACIPGDVVTVTGIIRVINNYMDIGGGKSKSKNQGLYYLYLEVVSIKNSKSQSVSEDSKDTNADAKATEMFDLFTFSPKDLEFIVKFSEEHGSDVFRQILQSICPSIYGHELVKAGLTLALFGGVRKHSMDQNKVPVRGDIHVIIVGDPGLGKSQLLQASASISPRGIYVCGNATTNAGLTVAVVKDAMTSDYAFEAGNLRNLQYIDFGNTLFNGSIPGIYNCTTLLELSLILNNLTGTIESNISDLDDMDVSKLYAVFQGVSEPFGNDRGKGKAARCTLVDEDMELEEVGGIDDGTYPIIDIADEDDDNINEDDLE